MFASKEYQASFRTSTHVHFNFSNPEPYENIPEDTLERIQNFLCLYYLVEDVFYGIAGSDRECSGYCSSFKTAFADFAGLLRATTASEFTRALKLSARYYGCNPKSLEKYGTIEFRHLPLTPSAEEMARWINTIMRLKVMAYSIEGDFGDYLGSITREQLVQGVFLEYPQAIDFLDEFAYANRVNALLGVLLTNVPGYYNDKEIMKASSSSKLVKAFFKKQNKELAAERTRAEYFKMYVYPSYTTMDLVPDKVAGKKVSGLDAPPPAEDPQEEVGLPVNAGMLSTRPGTRRYLTTGFLTQATNEAPDRPTLLAAAQPTAAPRTPQQVWNSLFEERPVSPEEYNQTNVELLRSFYGYSSNESVMRTFSTTDVERLANIIRERNLTAPPAPVAPAVSPF